MSNSDVPARAGAKTDDTVVGNQPNLLQFTGDNSTAGANRLSADSTIANPYQFTGDSTATVGGDQASGLNYYRFSGDGPDKARRETAPVGDGSPAAVAKAALESSTATAQEKLRAVEKLLSTGVDKLEITDKDGTTRQLRLELDMSVGKPLVHVFTHEGGKERVLLRAVSNGDGTYKNQRDDRKKTEVGFYGDWWTKNMSGKTHFAEGARSETANNDRYRPGTRADGQYMPRDFRPVARDQRPTAWDRFSPTTYPYQNDRVIPIPNISDMTNGSTDQAALNQAFDAAKNGLVNGRRPHYFRAGMTIDADGSPRARQIDPHGQLQTSLRYPGGGYVNAETVPYFVLPGGQYKHLGIKLGDIAAVRYNGKVAFAVFADVGPRHKLGEGSIALAQELGIPASPRTGGVRGGVEYMVFPGSGNGTPGDPRRNFALGAQLLRTAQQGDNRRYV
ncbi:MAG: glycoside hydrolase family 75 protein [Candidatus Melainabacteria bacterium]|jgi:hypothetical protein|nr:glycoside hydrolase family 75 protein [Candidatus Melainabacteria bacterium]